MIKKYLNFIKESEEPVEAQTEDTVDNSIDLKKDSKDYSDLKEEVKSMIEKTIEKSGGEYESFVDKFIKSPSDTKIEGFINDSDIYDFYLKFRNDIDELLNDIKYFGEVPSDSNIIGLYDFTIKGTERAVNEIVKEL
jgi:hypothetical protein